MNLKKLVVITLTLSVMGCASMKKSERLDTRIILDRMYEEKLSEWPVPYQSVYLSTRYGRTHVIESGIDEGELILLFHAMGFNGTTYKPNIEALSQKYKVLAIDTMGDQGRSIVRRDYPQKWEEYADWTADIINAAGYEKAHLVGCSMGGWIAHSAALKYPDKVDTLTLISAAAGLPVKTTWVKFLVSLIFNSSDKNVKRIVDTLLGPYQAGEDWKEYMFLATSDPKSSKLAFPKLFKDKLLRTTIVPTLLLVGDHEVVYKSIDTVRKRGEELIDDFTFFLIPDAGHMGHYDNPDFVNKKILEFITR